MLAPVSLIPAINCPPVSTTPAINCSPVSTTSLIIFYTGDKLYWRQRSVLSAKQSPANEVSHSRQYCHWNHHEKVQRHLIHPDQRSLRPPNYFRPKRHYLVWAINFLPVWQRWLTFIHKYLCEFSKKFKTSPMEYLGAWGDTYSWIKPEVENLMSDSL